MQNNDKEIAQLVTTGHISSFLKAQPPLAVILKKAMH
jgi:hypothetical protein